MQKISMFICFFMNVLYIKAEEKKIVYQCPWPDPEFSILSVRPTNLLRITPCFYKNKKNTQQVYVDVPFDWVVVDQKNKNYINLKVFGKAELQKDWTDAFLRPMRYSYKYLYIGIYGLLLPSSDGKPLALETSVSMTTSIDPITQKEIDCVSGYDYIKNKKLYGCDILIESDTLEAPILDEVSVSFEIPLLKIDYDAKKISCVYPEYVEKKSVFQKNKTIFSAQFPSELMNASVKIKSKNCVEFCL